MGQCAGLILVCVLCFTWEVNKSLALEIYQQTDVISYKWLFTDPSLFSQPVWGDLWFILISCLFTLSVDIIICLRNPVLLFSPVCVKHCSTSLDFLVLLPPWPTSAPPTLQLVLNNDLSAQRSAVARNSVALFSRLAQTLFYPINKTAVPTPVHVCVRVCEHTMCLHACLYVSL